MFLTKSSTLVLAKAFNRFALPASPSSATFSASPSSAAGAVSLAGAVAGTVAFPAGVDAGAVLLPAPPPPPAAAGPPEAAGAPPEAAPAVELPAGRVVIKDPMVFSFLPSEA